MVKVLDNGYIQIVETYGSDASIIEAARMSTDKGFQGWGHWLCSQCGEGKPDFGSPCECGGRVEYKNGDEKLLAYLWNNKHATPFEMAGAIVEVQAPIFVFREWHRHRTQSYNELSARYTALPDLFYHPHIDRLLNGGQATTNKQSSGATLSSDTAYRAAGILSASYRRSREDYELLLSLGVARELARAVIPTAQYSRMRASANLRNWLSFLTLREAPGAQWEIRQYANALHGLLAEAFPRTLALFEAG